MLIVKVEVWPGGEFDRAIEISRVGIANVSASPAPMADYDVTALLARDGDETVAKAIVRSHDRDLGWMPLVRRSLSGLFVADHQMLMCRYDDPVAELLRKGHRV